MPSPESDETPAGTLGEPLPKVEVAPGAARWHELRHGLAPIGDLDFLTRLDFTHIVAQAVLQLAQSNPFHDSNVAS